MKLSEFISLFRNTMEISLSVLHPVRGFIQFKLQKQKNQIKERQKQEELDRIACMELSE